MGGSWKTVSNLCEECVGLVTGTGLRLITIPLLTVLYLMCWIRAKLTAGIYCNNSTSLLSSEDIIPWLDIDRADNINAIIVIRGDFSLKAMKELFLSKVLEAKNSNNRPLFPKFTRYIKTCAGYLMWTEESNFDIDDHIRLYSGQIPGDEEQLKTIITDLCNEPLPSLKSGWEITVIPVTYRQSDVPQTCILFRVHHFIADGISISRLIFEQMAGNRGAFQHVLNRMQNKFKPQSKNAFVNMLANLGRINYKYILTNLMHPVHQNQAFIKDKSQLSDTGYTDWTSAIKLDTIRHIGHVTSTTVNDVIVSCMAGAFRKYFVKHDISPPDAIRIAVPNSFHGPEEPVEMSNKFYLMVISISTGDVDCLQRLIATKVETDRMKSSPENIIHRCYQQCWANIVPFTRTKQTLEHFNTDVVYSSNPGPTSKAVFDGNTIECLVLTILPPRKLGFAVQFITYSGNVTVSVTVDKAMVSGREEVRQLLDDFVEEVHQLYDSAIGSPNQHASTAMEKNIA